MSVWYENGVRFSCRRCGRCCIDRGEYAHVFLNEGEEKKLARALDLPVKTFLKKYTLVVEGYVALVNIGEACIFLDEKARCKVFEDRPLQCATWPFWTDSLEERVWMSEVAPNCPGIGKGRLYSAEEIDRIAFRSRAGKPLLRTRKIR